MLIKALATSLGGVTFVGGGVSIYLYNNKSNIKDPDNSDQENPEPKTEENKLDKKTEENVSEEKVPVNKQEELNKNKKIKKTTVKKAVASETYPPDKGPENDFYFLTKMNENLKAEDLENVTEMTLITADPYDFLQFKVDSNKTMDLPFYCFEGENVDSETELDLKNLKKCKDIKNTIDNKFVVIYYGDIIDATRNSNGGEISVLNSKKPTFEYTFKKNTGTEVKNSGEIISIFLETFSPTNIKASE